MEIGAYEAKTHFASLIERASRGERITITRRGKPVAELCPLTGAPALDALDEISARLEARRGARPKGRVPLSNIEIVKAKNEARR